MAAVRTNLTDEEKSARKAERKALRDADPRHADIERDGSNIAKSKAQGIRQANRERIHTITKELGDEGESGGVR